MNIVQVVPRYSPRTGGVEAHVKEISERLVTRGHDVTVLTADAGEDVCTMETRRGVSIIRHKGFAPNGAFHIAPGILRTLRRLNADVVHAHNYHSLPLLFAAIATSTTRFVVTPHYHGGSASSFRDLLLSLYRPFGKWAICQADAVIAVSEWEKNELRSDFGINTTVIPNGIDLDQYRDAEPESREHQYLLTVGRLEKYKGVQHALRALSELEEYDLVVAGSGPYKNALAQIATKEGVADRVDFLGYVDEERLPSLYTGADAFLSMSSFEAYGMTIGEALATGTPCVVREVGALKDWASREEVIGVDSVASPAIARAVRRAVGIQVRDPALTNWSVVVNRTLELYRPA